MNNTNLPRGTISKISVPDSVSTFLHKLKRKVILRTHVVLNLLCQTRQVTSKKQNWSLCESERNAKSINFELPRPLQTTQGRAALLAKYYWPQQPLTSTTQCCISQTCRWKRHVCIIIIMFSKSSIQQVWDQWWQNSSACLIICW